MLSENRKTISLPVDMPGLEMLNAPMIPPAEISTHPGAAGDPELNHWSEERISIYASLDAAMTRHIIEAISALSELKQNSEAEAFRSSQKIIVERDQLKREVEELRLEQLQLADQLNETRRQVQEEAARKMALEHSSAAWMEQARAEREALQLEIKRLKVQLEEVRRDLQTFYRNRADAVEASGGYAAWIENQADMEKGTKKESPAPPPPSTAPRVHNPITPVEKLPLFSMLEDDPPVDADLQEFDDTPTPRIEGGSPVIYLDEFAALAPAPAPVSAQESQLEAESPVNEAKPEQEVSSAPHQTELLEAAIPHVESPPPPRLSEQPVEKTRERNRRARTEQRVNHLLNKRRPLNMPGESPADSSGPSLPPAENDISGSGPGLPPIENVISRPKTSKRRLPVPEKIKADADKEVFQELGAQLGLDAMTPPPFSALQFAPGYTPPPQPIKIAEVVAEIKANASAIEVDNQPGPLVRPLKTNPRVTLAPKDLIEPEEGPRTLEQLLEDGEHELAILNENPTPPDEPTPFIGNLPDNAVHLPVDPLTSPGQAQPDKVDLAQIGDNDHTAPRRDRFEPRPGLSGTNNPAPIKSSDKSEPSRVQSEPSRVASSSNTTGQDSSRRRNTNMNFMPLPAPPADLSEAEMGETTVTKVIVSNLQGRFSPLVMEKVVRSLAEVSHVIVTDFSKGVLGMDVRHKKNFNLAEKLLALPELRLKLISHKGDELELSQENQN